MRRVVVDISNQFSASDHYRGVLPVRHCAAILKTEGIELTCSLGQPPKPSEVQGWYSRFAIAPELLIWLMEARRRGLKLAYDCDDLLLSVPEHNGFEATETGADLIRFAARSADFLNCASQTLATQMCQDVGRDISVPTWRVCPNLIDLNDWGWLTPGSEAVQCQHPQDIEPVRIAIAGTNTHRRDWSIITEALLKLVDKYRRQVRVIVLGEAIPEWIVYGFPSVFEIPFVSFADYPQVLRSLKPHIGLCPLEDCRFNRCKSSVKWSELTAAGAAVLASAGDGDENPYDTLPPRVLTRCANTTEAWYFSLEQLVLDHAGRLNQWRRAGEHLIHQHSWQASPHKQKWLELFRELAGNAE